MQLKSHYINIISETTFLDEYNQYNLKKLLVNLSTIAISTAFD